MSEVPLQVPKAVRVLISSNRCGLILAQPRRARWLDGGRRQDPSCTRHHEQFRVSGFGFRFVFRASGFGFRVSGFGCRVLGSGFRVSGFGFRV